ncbi:VRR-NUC domain-containing protein [Rhypophila decipiens]|uniref:Fanconi-associated nuclease n=1 Tax=Rhypophila decipiens TaxID=261697 RepID=A0AAN7B6S9_9PEZI|nr:VRR-NUC domain-containing protein [Rhypophila decipiens]
MDRFVKRSGPRTSTRNPSPSPVSREDALRPAKKRRIEVLKSEDREDSLSSLSSDDDGGEAGTDDAALKVESNVSDKNYDSETGIAPTSYQTAFESALPAVPDDQQAIQEYDLIKASQGSQSEGPTTSDETLARINNRSWVPGRSSIYVDAFNFALDTVLQDEIHLFNDKEKRVFEQWQSLTYEAQYLYVRLFLRKTASWHRAERLKSYTDISDVDLAIATLLQARDLPGAQYEEQPETEEVEGVILGDSFAFVDSSESYINTVEEAASQLSLDELKLVAKDAKVRGKNKAGLIDAICRMSAQQAGLFSFGIRRTSTNASMDSNDSQEYDPSLNNKDSNRKAHFLAKILTITGPLVRLSENIFKLFERVHLVFYRSTEWTEKSLTTIILARMSKRNFPEYLVCRSSNIFATRKDLIEFENAMRREYDVDQVLQFNGPPGEQGFLKIVDIFESISARWRQLLVEEQHKEESVYEYGEGAYLRRFNAAHAYTRIAHKAADALGRLHRYKDEYELLDELLSQRLFHPSRRGSWYQRKALLEEHYMWKDEADTVPANVEARKQQWCQKALATCEQALQDNDCHLIYHYDLQKRLMKLEKRLRVPLRLKHDFSHLRLNHPEEQSFIGIQLVRDDPDAKGKSGGAPSTKTIWLDELGEPGEDGKPQHVSVEEMCLSHYRSQGWKGFHSEGGILRTLFAYLFFDILFVYVPNVFQTAFQTCPLDLFTDAFYPTRASEINHRLVEIANGGAEALIRKVDESERVRRTCVVGLNWDFELEDLVELVNCFGGGALAAVCKVMAQDYRARGGGVPDLMLWRVQAEAENAIAGDERKGEVLFAEVKSANDRLSDTQRLWIHVLTGAGVRVALCNAVAKEVRTIG